MKKQRCTTLLATTLLSLAAHTAHAAPSLRVQVDQHGDFILVGNTLGYDCSPGTPAPVVGTIGACGQNTGDSAPDIFWRANSPTPGQAQADTTVTMSQARSTAMLNLLPGAAVTHAYLYWGATLPGPGTDTLVTLDGPGGVSQNITAMQSYQGSLSTYLSIADVTSIVQTLGSGAYRVSGVSSVDLVNLQNSEAFTAWYMVVFYERASEPLRNLALFDGLDTVSNVNPQNVTLSGFLVPTAGFDGKLGVITFEGDNSLSGDQLFFNGGSPLSDALNPATNFFNGTRSFLGSPVSVAGDLPRLAGTAQSMSGIDMDVVNITSKLSPAQSSATIQATSSSDVYHLAGFVTSISTFKPDFATSTKTVVDLNGGSTLPGDVLEYTILAQNSGNDTAINTVMTDPLPTGVTYVMGSLQITTGPNMGLKSDMAGDDQGEYNSGTRTVTVRLGSGATAAQGGSLVSGGSSTVKFRVTVDPTTKGTISNQATITSEGQLGAPSSSDMTDGNGSAAGNQPTDVLIDQCTDNSQCVSPTPYCDTAPTPNVCVECLVNSHCTATLPVCDPVSRTCVCNPSGPELCDGIDNDCDGMIDEGFNIGAPCMVGIGVCASIGIMVCNAAGLPVCNAVPGEPEPPELCGDMLDSDCDGDPNNGCVDTDNDGLFDDVEIAIGTNPNDADSDDDGVPDGQEPSYDEDSDGDGLINALDPDSDNDGLYDGTELGLGCNGAGTNGSLGHCIADGDMGATTTDPLDPDTDDGGVSDGSEDVNLNGVIDSGETDPTTGHGADDGFNLDSDNDGLSDGLEDVLGTDPFDADSDDDGLADGDEANPADDTDGDGLINALDPDSDNDALFDGMEMGKDCNGPDTDISRGNCKPDGDMGATVTSPVDADSDDGGVSDGSEDANQNGVIDAGETDPTTGHGDDDFNNIDSDHDGLSNAAEISLGTDPFDADTDDDGVLDGQEANPSADTDGDGIINALDQDSDGDGLFDGTEMGLGCNHPDTDVSKGNCIPDGDMGQTKTSAVNPDTDGGSVSDGDEDTDKDGVIDPGERDPNDPSDDVLPPECTDDTDCGEPNSGKVCDENQTCIDGCRGDDGNTCPDGQVCSSTDHTIGECMDGAGGANSASVIPDEGIAEGNGILCSAKPTQNSKGVAEWLFAAAVGLLMVRRHRLVNRANRK